jgi:hypothetical protein
LCGNIPINEVTSGGYHRECGSDVTNQVPDYLNDLNAMHDAILAMPEDFQKDFDIQFMVESARLDKYIHRFKANDLADIFLNVNANYGKITHE